MWRIIYLRAQKGPTWNLLLDTTTLETLTVKQIKKKIRGNIFEVYGKTVLGELDRIPKHNFQTKNPTELVLKFKCRVHEVKMENISSHPSFKPWIEHRGVVEILGRDLSDLPLEEAAKSDPASAVEYYKISGKLPD